MTLVRIDRRGRVACTASVRIPARTSIAWAVLRDFRTFAAQDFFHRDVRVEGGRACRGARLTIPHEFGPFRVTRVGRILRWEDGRGYSFSDLSRAGPRAAFPHVYVYELEPLADDRCRLDIAIRGRWTTRFLPRWLARLWLKWVFSHIARSVESAMLAGCLRMRPVPNTRGASLFHVDQFRRSP